MDKLKLFVVGESSGNPADWPIMCQRAYVFAHNPEEAVEISEFGNHSPVAEIIPDEPMVLIVEEDNGSDF